MPPPSNTATPTQPPAAGFDVGKVVFVGAGPGSPDLLTLRAFERLRQADVVVHDILVPETVLAAVKGSAERIPVPRSGGDDDPGLATGRLLVDLARRHRLVVRLKGGDPSVFARLSEEQQPLREAGIAWEIVPGVTAATAAAAAAGVPLTSRTSASSVTLVTGHEASAKEAPLDFAELARLPGTLVIYMGVDQIATWSRNLMAAGKSGDTPVTVVSRCSWPDQRTCITTLAGCGSTFDRARWPAPAIVIVGAVAAQGVTTTAAPPVLAGRTVLSTRPEGQSDEFESLVTALGGSTLRLPLIRIEPPESWQPLDEAIAVADTFDWIVFASGNGVRSFFTRLHDIGRDVRHLGTARIAAIGPATAREARRHGIACDLIPDRHQSEGIVADLGETAPHARFLLVRANRGRDTMRLGLSKRGHDVTEVAAYASRAIDTVDAKTLAMLDRTGIDWITITSSFIAETACRLFGDRMHAWKVASISPVTTATLARAGVTAAVEAARPTVEKLVEAIAGWEAAHRPPAHPAESAGSDPAAS